MTASPHRRRLGLVVAVVALVASLSACDDAVLNSLVDSYVTNADANELNGGDGVTSIDIGGDKTLVLVNDPYVGPVNPDGTRQSGYLVNNALLVFDRTDGSVQTLLGPSRSARFKPATAGHYYWLSHGVLDGGSVHLLLQERLSSTWEVVANAVITISTSTFAQTGSTITLAASAAKPAWGTTIVTVGSYHYLYGMAPQDVYTQRTLVARVPTGSLRTLSSWRYWTGTGWSTSQSSAVPLVDSHGAPLPYLMASMPVSGDLVSIGSGTVFEDHFTWAASASPIAPYTVGTTAYAPPEALTSCGGGATEIVYGMVPQVATPTNDSLWAYSRNCWAIPPATPDAHVETYQPQYVNLDLGDAPEPCPAPTTTFSQKLIKAAYLDFLHVDPVAPGDLSYWTSHIAGTGYCDTPLFAQLALDDGFSGEVIDDAYQQLLGRAASSGDLTYWRPGVEDQSTTVADLAQGLISSTEFFTLSGSTNGGFVDRLYLTVLGRAASSSERSYWVGQLTGGSTRGTVGRAIYQSGEGRDIRVQALAQRYLQRTFDATSLAQWRTTLSANGGNDIAMAVTLADLPEYWATAQTRF